VVTAGTGVPGGSGERDERAKSTYINISFPNFDVFSEIVLFYPSATSFALEREMTYQEQKR
jgi:hypothetical protein